ncbi:DUF4179 domain-containing protein [Paenibacillus uliginis]|uniref:DUF4179 domain-containing protein n=1 Tax=Paenibacillus uliginis TaxID=683737 RepID=UPI001FCCFE4D|nr:DUF4179 domain-containing protein [Paenibacillus uliginis]
MKQTYHDIEIPAELAAVTQQAIERGKSQRKRTITRNRWMKTMSASTAAVLAIFVISVNTMPAFANSLEDVPGLGKLVKILQFNKGSAEGGTIQDSTDVSFITLRQQGSNETITLNFTKQNQTQEKVNAFHVKFTEYPNTMTFSVGGARAFSAVKDFETLKKSEYIQDAYEIITLDDSLIRFNVTFNKAITYDVKEYADPAQVVITITPDDAKEKQRQPVYSLRTASHPYGETQGAAEEALLGWENIRILKDREGTFFVEAGYYATETEARAKLKQLEEQGVIGERMYVEEREPMQLPMVISPE